ncbi:MAG: pyruvate carboxylase [Myxococcaceae bacterium]
MPAIKKLMCANRGEIAIRVFRACNELGIRTVAIYSDEDRLSEHRHKADEAYLVGRGKRPVDAYLGIDEILDVAVQAKVDAIHPGYGFLSENPAFARACVARGIRLVGPTPEVIALMGDKVAAKTLAQKAGVATVPGMTLSGEAAAQLTQARDFFAKHGAPVLVKAANGGGGRGMRVVRAENELEAALASARSESLAAFGSDVVFLEKFLEKVRHIEVQLLGDQHGNLVHLFERDCSVQRRHQKVIEIAPAPSLSPALRDRICAAALTLGQAAKYSNAGTVEFLVSNDDFYFIEVNARLQVEHTVTEQVTGIDLVQAQIHVAEGEPLGSPKIGLASQASVATRGYAIQLRVTTEDPANNFMPDAGTITAWRAATGFGIRLDGSNGYPGAVISSAYDSMLVKVIAYAHTFDETVRKAQRAVREFRIRGVKTNLPFLENVLGHPLFRSGQTWTRFIDDTKELFQLSPKRDRASKMLRYLGDIVVNGHPTVKKDQRLLPSKLLDARVPQVPAGPPPKGTTQILQERGAEGLAKWVLEQKQPLLTDTTMRDAHQSLLATRMRSYDVLKIAHATAHLAPELFSLECWGGATFDTAYRFLDEDPWERLRALKQAVPNLLLQMLLRGANAVGYTHYPDNVVEAFIDEAAEAGLDVFRIFDSLNDIDSMKVSIERVRKTGKVAEVAICYTGDVANPKRPKYTLDYYAELAKKIEGLGAHFLCIKDMAGLLRPRAAGLLLDRLRETVKLPIHLHTHDTSGNGVAMLLTAIDHGVHIVDAALAPMAGLTSQPSINALVAALRGYPRDTGLTNKKLQPLANYWEDVREYYAPFECGLKSSTSEVYFHEIPGGQYSNLRPQVAELGLLGRWQDVKDAFAVVNMLCGDIPKVTPSSKMVGDFAIFLVKNDLLVRASTLDESVKQTEAKLRDEAPRLDFPESVVGYFQGQLGQPPGGFPEKLRAAVLKGLPAISGRPGGTLKPLDLEGRAKKLSETLGRPARHDETISHALYPRVMDAYFERRERFEDLSILDTPTYFYGLEVGQERWIQLETGKTLVVQLDAVSDAAPDGSRTVFFQLNGHGRQVTVKDRALAPKEVERRAADKSNPLHVGASMPGTVIAVHQQVGAKVEPGMPLMTLEAMKMETVVRCQHAGTVKELVAPLKGKVQAGDLLVVLG